MPAMSWIKTNGMIVLKVCIILTILHVARSFFLGCGRRWKGKCTNIKKMH